MKIGILDLLVIYAIPLVLLAFLVGSFLFILYLIVKKDIGHFTFSEDLRYNIEIRKRSVSLGTVAQFMLFDGGTQAIFLHRCARYFHLHGLNPIANVLHKMGKYLTNVDIPPTAKVGPGVVFLHCCNIVISPYAELGKRVVFRPWSGVRGWGTVKLEDGVRVGLMSIVMDCVTMGENSESAPGSIVIQDVPAEHIAYGLPAKRMIPRPEKLEGVILELENVLVEPTRLFAEALGTALCKAGKDLPKPGKWSVDDLPPAAVIARQVPKDAGKLERVLEDYMNEVRSRMPGEIRLCTGARELVQKIKERGLKIAVISRQPEPLAKETLDQLGLSSYLDLVCGPEDALNEWKPQPWIIYRPMRELKLGVERVIYIAGRPLDMLAGGEAAVRVFWISRQEPTRAPPRGLVDRYPDLAALLEEFSKPLLPPTI